jgi:hypothetical protein
MFPTDTLGGQMRVDADAVVSRRLQEIKKMSTPFKKSVVFAAIIVGLAAASARAEDIARVKVSFPFVVRGQTLPAGRYDIRVDDLSPGIVYIVGIKGTKGQAIIPTITAYGRNPAGHDPSLTFVRHENEYRLSAVWETDDYAREIPKD